MALPTQKIEPGPSARPSKPRLTGLRLAGIGCTALFMLLLSVRLGFWTPDGTGPNRITPAGAAQSQDVWMNILQNGRKIGYSHRLLIPTENGYTSRDAIQMQINTMGLTQPVVTETRAELSPDMALRQFEFTLRSGRFSFHASGLAQGKVMTVKQRGQELIIPLETDIYLSSGLLPRLTGQQLSAGQSVAMPVFDPSTMGQRTATVVFEGNEQLRIMEREYTARRFRVDFMGAQQFAWVAEDGQVLKEKGLLGLTLERVSRQEAMAFSGKEPVADLTRLASVPIEKPLSNPERLKTLVLRIGGVADPGNLAGGRQLLQGDTVTIRRETLPQTDSAPPESVGFTGPSAMVPSDHPRIRAQVREILDPVATDFTIDKARRLVMWVYANIEKMPVISVPNALEVLEKRQGDCNEHAVLLAALARAAGIPAAIETGLVYLDGRFYYHAWNRLYVGRWVTADALMNQLPADVTHLRLSAGESSDQLDLLGIIGRIRLDIVKAD